MNTEINLNDQGTLDALKLTDVMASVKEDLTPKPQATHTFTRKFTQDEVDRMSRLSPDGDWKLGINSFINETLATRVGRAVIKGASFHGTVTGPSKGGNY